jgi:hypothetical protein
MEARLESRVGLTEALGAMDKRTSRDPTPESMLAASRIR